MELLLLKLVALVRPLASIRFGEELFALLGVGLMGILVAAFAVRTTVHKSLRLSSIDALIFAFVFWCVARALIYADGTYVQELAKLVIPLLSFTLAKNVITDRKQYVNMLFWIIVGFSVPTVMSAVLIAVGDTGSLAGVKYQTGIPRWQGAYADPHSFGHSMTLFLVAIVLYVTLRGTGEGATKQAVARPTYIIPGFLGSVALYCLYMGQVRSALLGLLVFATLYGYLQNKKMLVLGAVAVVVVAAVTASVWVPALLHEFTPDRRGGELDVMQMGSGRLIIWTSDIDTFARLPLDKQLAGIGIGTDRTEEGTFGGHNDWLRIIWDTGVIGFLLFVSLQIAILKAILRLTGSERHFFLALFAAVNIMMAVSNSYALRIQVSHLYYIMLAFIQLPSSPMPSQSWQTVPRRSTVKNARSTAEPLS